MLFNSLDFLWFFPVVVGLYYVVPQKLKNIWLLLASYYFYMCWNARYILLIVFSTIVTYGCGLLLERESGETDENRKRLRKKCYVAAGLFLNLSLLFVFKYWNFTAGSLNWLLQRMGITEQVPQYHLLLPVGISFYTFQALGYTIDVYREEIRAERNFIQYALFVSFFPQLVAGPVERAGNLLRQLKEGHPFSYDRAREGVLLMIWGYFLKLVLADRIAIVVDTIYGDYGTYGGVYLLVATVLFAFQIYCDFAGYSTIAVGGAMILGFTLMENFNAPYLAVSVSDFWRRWHISLSTWFRDYMYIPLGGNRKGSVRRYCNLLLVFCASGLWHGAEWTFVIWGGLNGLYQVAGRLLKPAGKRIREILQLKENSLSHRFARGVITFVLIDFAWLFFRAQNMTEAVSILKSILTVHNPWILFDDSLYGLGLSAKSFRIIPVALGILLFADVMKYKGICIRKIILQQDYWFRWLTIVGSILLISLVGIWGSAYNAADFIYFQF